MRAGTSVEFGDEVPGGGDHDRVEPSRSIGNPSVERILRRGGPITDMNTAVIKVELQPRRVALADGKRRCRFGGVGEAMQLSQAEGAVGLLDVAQHTAGADRGELLIITDQPDTPTTSDHELDGGVEGQSVGHPGFVDDHQVDGPTAAAQSGSSPWSSDQVSLARVSLRIPVCSARTAAAAADGARPST